MAKKGKSDSNFQKVGNTTKGASQLSLPEPEDISTEPRFAALLSIIAVGFILRLIYIYQIQSDIFTQNLIVDAKSYDDWAQRIISGEWLGKEVFYQDPLYPYFLAVCYKVFGHHLNIIRILQAILDTGTIGLLYLTASLLFNVRTGLVVSAMAALYGPMVFYTGLLDKTTLTTFLIASSLALICYASNQSKFRWFFVSGLALGLASLIRGNMLFVVLGLFFWLLSLRKNTEFFWSSARRAGAFACGVALIVGLVTLRNYWVSKDIVLRTSDGGLNFFIGNNPYTIGAYIEPPFIHGIPEREYEDSRLMAERLSGKKINKASAVSSFWFRQGWNFILKRPGDWVALAARKFFLTYNGFEIPDTFGFDYFRDNYRWLTLAFVNSSLVCPLGLLGLVAYFFKKGWNELHVFYLSYLISLIALYVSSRYRFPIILPLLLFGAWFLAIEIPELRKATPLKLALTAFSFIALVTFCNAKPRWVDNRVIRPGLATPHTLAGLLYYRTAGNYQAAIRELEISKKLDPNGTGKYLYLGECYQTKGDINQALANFLEVLKRDPYNDEAFAKMGETYLTAGNYAMALSAFENAFKLKPTERVYAQNVQLIRQYILRK